MHPPKTPHSPIQNTARAQGAEEAVGNIADSLANAAKEGGAPDAGFLRAAGDSLAAVAAAVRAAAAGAAAETREVLTAAADVVAGAGASLKDAAGKDGAAATQALAAAAEAVKSAAQSLSGAASKAIQKGEEVRGRGARGWSSPRLRRSHAGVPLTAQPRRPRARMRFACGPSLHAPSPPFSNQIAACWPVSRAEC
jgi:hypothetical protein